MTTETNIPPPPPAAGPAPSDPAADTWVTSQLPAPPSATRHRQLIIVERRGQTPERVVSDLYFRSVFTSFVTVQQFFCVSCQVIVTGQSEGREVFVVPSIQLSGSQLAVIGPAGSCTGRIVIGGEDDDVIRPL